jgi:hypothetical protein
MSKFKKGDWLKCVDGGDCKESEGLVETGRIYQVREALDDGVRVEIGALPAFLASDWFGDWRFELLPEEYLVRAGGQVIGVRAPAPENTNQSMRFNTDKPQMSYLLSFAGGVELLFPELDELGRWYRSGVGASCLLVGACEAILETLNENWPEQLAKVAMFGEKKYARGNYLKGRGWSDTCDSLLRHMDLKRKGQEIDDDSKIEHDGHIAWNVLFLLHCVNTMPERDDRIRAPKQEAA